MISLPYSTSPSSTKLEQQQQESYFDSISELLATHSPRFPSSFASTSVPLHDPTLFSFASQASIAPAAPPPAPVVPSMIPMSQCGHCVIVRSEGATVRDGPDIDNSRVLGRSLTSPLLSSLPPLIVVRIPCGGEFHFCRTQLFPPADEECVEVLRLLGYARQQSISTGRLSVEAEDQELWISLTGRNLDDHDPIALITRHPSC